MAVATKKHLISQQEYAAWLAPSVAVQKIAPFKHPNFARDELWRRLQSGLLRAVAGTMIIDDDPHRHLQIIPKSMWGAQDEPPDYDALWNFGSRTFVIGSRSGYGDHQEVSCFDIRFETAGVEAIIISCGGGRAPTPEPAERTTINRTAPSQAVQPRAIENKGGRPRKGWWDDLWIEVLRKIADGRLHADSVPSGNQLEYVLLDIAKELGFSPGDSTLKPMALKLFKYLKEIGGK